MAKSLVVVFAKSEGERNRLLVSARFLAYYVLTATGRPMSRSRNRLLGVLRIESTKHREKRSKTLIRSLWSSLITGHFPILQDMQGWPPNVEHFRICYMAVFAEQSHFVAMHPSFLEQVVSSSGWIRRTEEGS